VLVQGGEIVGEGWHERAGQPHAEPLALAAAGARARGATAYVTLEPCSYHGRTPPCTDALIDAGIAAVTYALRDPNPRVSGSGDLRLRDAGINVRSGLMGEASRELNIGFVKRMTTGLPFVRVKLAMSLDGRTALASGESRWITADTARKDAQRFRARSSAIVTGIGTVLADDPAMNVRIAESDRQPWRVVLDSDLRTPPESRLVNRDGPVLIFATRDAPQRRAALLARSAAVELLPARAGRPDLQAMLERLAALEMNEVWVEAGQQLAGAFVQAGLFDELIVYVAPALLGGDAQPLLQLPALKRLDDKLNLRYTDVRQVGDDLRLTLRPA
jgi:diaminohydroxyphosphoribosylaminopyrimidine deaminase/5-amino-6-(5-phosphoribosylamino)uracil reductase